MRTRVQKWGNSLAVRIPKPFAEGAGLEPSTEVEMVLDGVTLRIAPARPRWNLRRLLGGISKQNVHDEVATGARVGREVW
jgi:antitoxin MazE